MNTLQIGDVSLYEREGGLGRYFSELLRHLPLVGTEHHGLVIGRTGPDEADSVSTFARLDDAMPLRMVKGRRAGLLQMRARSIDLLVAHFAPYALPLLDRTKTTPLIVHFHGPWAGESTAESAARPATKVKAMVERLVYCRASRLIVLSDYFKRELMQRYSVNEERIHVVPGGIDCERFNTRWTRSEARAHLGWPQDRFIVLSVRRQVRRMGLEELIEAARLLIPRRPELLLLLGGTGPISNELQLQIKEHGLEENVKLLGRVDDAMLPLAYRAANVSVVPSRMLEGFGLVTLESLASGTPVFVTAVGGLPEVVAPFAPACIFKDASAAGMAAGLDAALSGSETLPSDEACRDYAVNHFGWPSIASRVRAVYDGALA